VRFNDCVVHRHYAQNVWAWSIVYIQVLSAIWLVFCVPGTVSFHDYTLCNVPLIMLPIFIVILWRASRSRRPPNSLPSIVSYDRTFIRNSLIPLVLITLLATILTAVRFKRPGVIWALLVSVALPAFSVGIVPATFSVVSGYLEDAGKTAYSGIAFGCLTSLGKLGHMISVSFLLIASILIG
jgi:hypothetical protein